MFIFFIILSQMKDILYLIIFQLFCCCKCAILARTKVLLHSCFPWLGTKLVLSGSHRVLCCGEVKADDHKGRGRAVVETLTPSWIRHNNHLSTGVVNIYNVNAFFVHQSCMMININLNLNLSKNQNFFIILNLPLLS